MYFQFRTKKHDQLYNAPLWVIISIDSDIRAHVDTLVIMNEA